MKDDVKMIFFTADLHLGHENIIEYCARPFRTVGEMDSILISNWNAAVKPDDTVYILGDMLFCKSPEKYLTVLNGRKYLMIGNHDRSWLKYIDRTYYFEDVTLMTIVPYTKQHLLTLCHYPMMCWSGDRKGRGYMIHGHLHNGTDAEYFKFIRSNMNMLNAGVDINNFKPVTFEELLKNNQKFKKMAASIR